MKKIVVTKYEAGQRLDKLLIKYLDKATTSFIYKMMRKKNIVLNDKKAKGSEKVIIGDIVKMYLSDETIAKFSSVIKMDNDESIIQASDEKSDELAQLNIVYEDDNILLINKPAGVLSQKASVSDVSINEMIIAYLQQNGTNTTEHFIGFKPSVCHRLDRNTTGLIMAGKNLRAQQELSDMFKLRSIDKYYLCIVEGVIDSSQKIEGYLVKNAKTNKVSLTDRKSEDSEYIETEYRPLKAGNEYTLLEVKLITGKAHQIRAHLAGNGHPIVGDYKYGNRNLNDYFKKKYNVKYQLLHSYRLVFPDKGYEELSYLSGREFKTEIPDKFNEIIKGEF